MSVTSSLNCLCLVLVASCLAVPTLSADELGDKFSKAEFKNKEGQRLLYRFLKPASLEAGKKYPIVIFFHGAGERGDDNEKTLIHGVKTFATEEFLKKYPCFVVVPQCPNEQMWMGFPWTVEKVVLPEKPTESLSLAMQCLDSLEKEFPIDTDREYVTGLSMGGFGTWESIVRSPNRFAAAVPICAGCDVTKAKSIAHLPIWAYHGAKDGVVKVERSREIIEALKAAGGTPKYTEYPEVGHDSWNGAYKDQAMYEWLFSQRRKS